MVIDLGIRVSNQRGLNPLVDFARNLGFSGIGVSNVVSEPFRRLEDGFMILSRVDITGKRLSTLRKSVAQNRRRVAIIGLQLMKNLETANWAAEDRRIDLITLDYVKNNQLKGTTASLAAESGTALEIQFSPLLHTHGLARSKILKKYRESVRTALNATMPIVLSSGADAPLEMRAPVSLLHIAELLGIEYENTVSAVRNYPRYIVKRNLAKLDARFVAEGIEIVEKGRTR